MEKQIKGIIDSNDRRYWVEEYRDNGLAGHHAEYFGCVITRNENGSFNVKNDSYIFDCDLYQQGIKAVIYK